MSFQDPSKTEAPTPRRRAKAREEGNVARSMELNSAVVLVVSSLMLLWFGGQLTAGLKQIMISLFRHMGTMEITTGSLPVYMWMGMKAVAFLVAPIFLGIMVAGVAVNVGQVGFKITGKNAYPKFSRINPISGFQRLFTMRSLVELGKSLLKLAVIGGVVYLTIASQYGTIYNLSRIPVENLGIIVGKTVVRLFLVVSLSLIVIGILDYIYNRFEFEKSLKMTKEEVKEEARQSDGDPKVKGKIRETMFKNAYRRMMQKVPEADVVLANPIHLAVALKYDRTKGNAPIVVAKGARKVAERIKQIAREHDIPVIENPPLARALYKAVEIGDEIPADLYKAVAEVLAYVYRLKRKFFGVA
ncbi:MAG TPA: flagellar biosynthesis protein FlhB [bacterium]|jgi:flagellar biosynthetic protein FlhB